NSLVENRTSSVYLDNKALLRYEKVFDQHHLSLLGGFSYEDYSNDDMEASRYDFLFPGYTKLNSGAAEDQRNSGTTAEWALMSYFGRLNYDYRSKYLVEVNVRRDGSSRFLK